MKLMWQTGKTKTNGKHTVMLGTSGGKYVENSNVYVVCGCDDYDTHLLGAFATMELAQDYKDRCDAAGIYDYYTITSMKVVTE
jgi:hypothetical protein